MKKAIAIVLVSSMLSACSDSSMVSTNESGSTAIDSAHIISEIIDVSQGFNPGIYTASSTGRNGAVELSVSFSEDAIESIEVKHEETEDLGDKAIDELISITLEEQNVPTDAISGATISSTAYKTALTSTINQALGNVDTDVEVENTSSQDAISIIRDAHTTWSFTDEKVKDEDIETIINAALNTPSAVNAKPWQFNVVTDSSLIEELADTAGSKNAPLMIIISVNNENEMKILDAGLVTEAMAVTAQLLGYDTKIETAPARTIRNDTTGRYASILDIPDTKSARAALFIGYSEQNIDSSSSATITENSDEYVKYNRGD